MKPLKTSVTLLISLLLLMSTAYAAPPPGKGKPDSGGGTDDGAVQCEYPSFADSPKDKLRGDEANFYIQYGDVLSQMLEGSLVFDETGSANSALKTESSSGRWFVEDMSDVQHRVGNDGIEIVESNAGMDEQGNSCELPCSPAGKRWSGWYDGPLLSEWDGSYLSLGGLRTMEVDLTRPGAGKWYNNKLYTTWLSTLQRQVDPNGNGIYGSRKQGSQTFKPNMYLKSQVSFEQMQTPGFRLSMWLMPVEKNTSADMQASPSIAYDGNPKNGFEMDIFEFEPVAVLRDPTNDSVDKVCGNAIEFSWINAFYDGKGKAPAGIDGKNNFEGAEEGYCSSFDCSDTFANPIPSPDGKGLLRRDINLGSHLIEFLWTDSAIVWAFNGEIVLEITNVDQMPDVNREHYLIVSREMTNGLTSGTQEYDGGDYFLPPEPGLYGWNGNSNIGDHFELINDDKALIDFIEIYHAPVQ